MKKKPTPEIDCPKHGRTRALPVIDGVIRGHEDWPEDYMDRPRVCIKCLAASMVSPVRRSPAHVAHP